MKETTRTKPSVKMTNLSKENTQIIIGNPGCGKTTRLIQKLSHLYEAGVPLNRIGYCSFSVAAIDEAISRALTSLTTSKNSSETCAGAVMKKDMLYFRTLHSMAFQLLGLATDNLMTDDQTQDFSRLIELPISRDTVKKNGFHVPKVPLKGDKVMHIINTAKQYNLSVREYCQKHNVFDIQVDYLEDIQTKYEEYKILNSLYDYTDMLIMINSADENDFPELDYLFIDEAQDLSTIQWCFVNKLAKKSANIIIAGDDKQSINEFAGADVDTFLSLPGKVEVLEQSYRVPARVFNLANRVMKYMKKYRAAGAKWKPRAEEGSVIRCTSMPYADMLSGEWFILTRTSYQMEKIKNELMRRTDKGALLFTVDGVAPIDLDIFRAINILQLASLPGFTIRNYLQIEDTDSPERRKDKLDYIYMFKKFATCSVPKNAQPWEINEEFINKLEKNNWQTALDKIPLSTLIYASRLYKQYTEKGDDLFKDAPIKIMTVHKAKGREADNVVVVTDVSRTVKQTISEGVSDVEAKITYVAVTRAKKKLYLYTENQNTISLNKYL